MPKSKKQKKEVKRVKVKMKAVSLGSGIIKIK